MQYTLYKGRKKSKKPYRWRQQGDNNEILAQGQAYKNHQDCLDAITLVPATRRGAGARRDTRSWAAMNRRSFLGAVAGLAVAPALPALSLPVVGVDAAGGSSVTSVLFRGGLGRYEGFVITEQAARVYSAALFDAVMRKSHLRGVLIGLGVER